MKDVFGGCSVLIVGGAGFVGSNLARMLLQHEVASLTIVDNLLSAERENLPDDGRIEFREGSIADDAILAEIDDSYDYVFHLATYHGNQSSIHDPIADHQNNTLTTLKLFWHMRGFERVRKIVYSAAGCAVAAKTDKKAKATEESTGVGLDMDSPYSISKIIGEFYSVYFHKQHSLPVVRARFQNVYGPGEVLGAGKWRGTPATVWRNVTPTFIYKAMNSEALPLQNEGRGTRDFIYVDDICRGLMHCAANGEAGDVYNLASGAETSIRTLAEMINELAGNATPSQMLPKRPWDNSIHRFGSTQKASDEIGFSAQVPLAEGLTRTVEWTKSNIDRIERNIAKHAQHMPA